MNSSGQQMISMCNETHVPTRGFDSPIEHHILFANDCHIVEYLKGGFIVKMHLEFRSEMSDKNFKCNE